MTARPGGGRRSRLARLDELLGNLDVELAIGAEDADVSRALLCLDDDLAAPASSHS